jgi:hypothetical protein
MCKPGVLECYSCRHYGIYCGQVFSLQIFIALKSTIFWDGAPSSLVEFHRTTQRRIKEVSRIPDLIFIAFYSSKDTGFDLVSGQKVCELGYLLSVYLWLYNPLLGLDRFFSFLIFYTVGMTPCKGDQPVSWPLPAHRTAQTQNKCTYRSMPQVGFEPNIPVFERAKTVQAFDRAATVFGGYLL